MKQFDMTDLKKERQFLGGLIRKYNIFQRIYKDIPREVFTSRRLKMLYGEMVNSYENTFSRLTFASLAERLKRRETDDTEIRMLRVLWKKCLAESNNISESMVFELSETIRKLYRARKITEGQLEVLNYIRDGEIDEALATWNQRSIEFTDMGDRIAKYSFLDTYKSVKNEINLMKKYPERFKGIPTGLWFIDKYIGGLRKSELGLVVAGTGKGKSITLMNMGINAWNMGYNVLYFTIEMKGLQIAKRAWCKATEIPYDRWRNGTLTDDDMRKWKKRYFQLKKQRRGAIFDIIDVPEQCSSKLLKSLIREQSRQNTIDLVLIDYMNIMATNKGESGYEWIPQVVLSNELHQISRYFDVPIWTAAQLSAMSDDNPSIVIQDLGYAKSIPQNIDIGVALGQSQEMKLMKQLNVSFFKHRDIAYVPETTIRTQFDMMTFRSIGKRYKQKSKQKKKRIFFDESVV